MFAKLNLVLTFAQCLLSTRYRAVFPFLNEYLRGMRTGM